MTAAINPSAFEFGQVAEGNDFHRRADNERRINSMIARQEQRELNITEWRRRIAEAEDNGDHETADNIRIHLAAGHD